MGDYQRIITRSIAEWSPKDNQFKEADQCDFVYSPQWLRMAIITAHVSRLANGLQVLSKMDRGEAVATNSRHNASLGAAKSRATQTPDRRLY
jgi:hypothetical protein